jgi:hypothetical protein
VIAGFVLIIHVHVLHAVQLYVMALSETEVLGFTTDVTLLVWRADPGQMEHVSSCFVGFHVDVDCFMLYVLLHL